MPSPGMEEQSITGYSPLQHINSKSPISRATTYQYSWKIAYSNIIQQGILVKNAVGVKHIKSELYRSFNKCTFIIQISLQWTSIVQQYVQKKIFHDHPRTWTFNPHFTHNELSKKSINRWRNQQTVYYCVPLKGKGGLLYTLKNHIWTMIQEKVDYHVPRGTNVNTFSIFIN